MTTRRWMRLWALLVLWWLGSAQAGEPTTQPLLRLETGMHTATIRRIATDAAGRWAVTASDDKTARIWDVASGELVGVLRVPQDGGKEGKLFAVAMSPDGAQVAVAGWTGWDWQQSHSIYLFDRATQRLTHRLSDLPNAVLHLAYSSDGHWLAAGLWGQSGVYVFDPSRGSKVGSDVQYGDSVYSVEFSPENNHIGWRLLSTSYDGKIRLHHVSDSGKITLQAAVPLTEGKRPYAARFSPDGRRVAVGFSDTRAVQLLDGRDLRVLALMDTNGQMEGSFNTPAWSADGQTLAAAGQAWYSGNLSPVRLWSARDGSVMGDIAIPSNTVMDLVALPKTMGAGWLFASSNSTWGVLDSQARVLMQKQSHSVDLRGIHEKMQLSDDGHRVRFSYIFGGEEPAWFDVRQRMISSEVVESEVRMNDARQSAPKLIIEGWKNNEFPTVNGRPIRLRTSDMSRSLAVTPSGRHFALGTEWQLSYFDHTGKKIWPLESTVTVPSAVWAVNISADARWVVAGYGDGTIRWHRIEDGKEVLAFFPHADSKRWVLWTPEGYYDASPGAEDLIGYHLNHGKDSEGEFVAARQLRETFYQPNLISQRLGPQGDELMRQAVAKRGDVRELLRAGTTPELVLESAAAVTSDGRYQPVVKVQNAGQGEPRLVLRINGAEVDARRTATPLTPGRIVKLPDLDLPAGKHAVSVELVDGRGIASKAVTAQVTVPPKPAATAGFGTTLHVLTVGISAYRDKSLERGVAFAAKDAQAVADAFKTGARGLFAKVLTTVLPNEQASRDSILQAGRALASAKPDDTVVIYLAGHGTSADGDYHFVPWETRYTGFESLRKQALAADHLREMLSGILARKVLVLLDTCSAGTFTLHKGRAIDDKASLDRFQRMTGRAMMAAAADEKMALEGENQHGVFTSALLSGLQGAADKDGDRTITVAELGEYIDEQVPSITKRKWQYEQFPMMELRGNSFALTRAGK